MTIELTAPLSIGTGRAGDFEDDLFVVDANGLPAIPGTALAGVLRRAWAERVSEEAADAVFGYMNASDGAEEAVGQRSRLTVSWGHIHDQCDRPVASLADPASLARDDVLANARQGMVRDHVRIDAFGVVDGRGKFDRSSVAAGHRFTFELEWQADVDEERQLQTLLGLLDDPAIRLGGHSRAGLGRFRIERCSSKVYDLSAAEDLQAYCALPAEISEEAALDPCPQISKPLQGKVSERYVVELVPLEPWVVGGTSDDWAQPFDDRSEADDTPPDLVPYRERRIEWKTGARGSTGRVGELEYVVPATALKGVLRHRTAFHLRAKKGVWADQHGVGLDDPGELLALFGRINDAKSGEGGRLDFEGLGWAGRLFVSDGRVVEPPRVRKPSWHVSLDRFTGAPMQGLLFTDQGLEGGKIRFELYLPPRNTSDDLDAAREALFQVFEELGDGMLQLGAGYGRGYGWFEGTVEGPNHG